MSNVNITNLKTLLQKVSAISTKYEEIAKATGANYNVFNILGLSTREVRTHSAFIADLLNPDGLHGRGNVFLKLFIQEIKNKLDNDSCYKLINKELKKTVIVRKEKFTGWKNKDGTEGGNIDISIESNNKAIIIENKINAGDQDSQLLRYYNYGIQKYKKGFILLYLTLDGVEASKESTTLISYKDDKESIELKGNQKEEIKLDDKDYFLISYQENILKWLTECKKETIDFPLLRETLTQYINLIKQLTGQAMNDEMSNEVTNLISKNSIYINAVFDITDNFYKLKKTIIEKLIKEVKDHFSVEKYKINVADGFGLDKDTYLYVYKENSNFGFGFGFDRNDSKDFFYGIVVIDIDKINENDNKINRLKEKSIDTATDYWPYNAYSEYRYWNKEVFVKIANGEFSKYMIDKIKDLISIKEAI